LAFNRFGVCGVLHSQGREMGNQIYKQRHRDLGLCVDCSEPVYPDKTRCIKHMRNNCAYSAGYYQRNIEHYRLMHKRIKAKRIRDGCCKICGAPLDPDADCGMINCMNCRGGIIPERLINGTLIV
jgi:hypothetical protein